MLKMLEEQELEKDLEEMEMLKNDWNKCYKAIRNLQMKKAQKPLLVKDENGNIATTENQKIKLITKYFKEVLVPTLETELKKYKPTKMRNPFTRSEITKSAKLIGKS